MNNAGSAQTSGERVAVVALIIFIALGMGSTIVVAISKQYMSAHWGGGNFPPLIGHLVVILVGGLLLLGNIATVLATIISLYLTRLHIRRRSACRLAMRFIGTAVISGLLLVIQCYMWSTQ